MAKKPDPATKLADAALRVLAKKPWRDISLAEIARAAKVPLSGLATLAPTKSALIGLMLRRFGEKVAKSHKPDKTAASGRDRLFDVGMAWFDAMTPHKAAIRSLYDGFRGDP